MSENGEAYDFKLQQMETFSEEFYGPESMETFRTNKSSKQSSNWDHTGAFSVENFFNPFVSHFVMGAVNFFKNISYEICVCSCCSYFIFLLNFVQRISALQNLLQ